MTGPELYPLLFTKRGELSEFAAYCDTDRQTIARRFEAVKINIDTLKKYAEWKNLPESKFIAWATGYHTDQPPTKTVEEAMELYSINKKNSGDTMIYENLIMQMLADQREKNAALMKLANAAEINSITIAKLSGVEDYKIDIVLTGATDTRHLGKAKAGS
jgi:hypothetical protein